MGKMEFFYGASYGISVHHLLRRSEGAPSGHTFTFVILCAQSKSICDWQDIH
jgi:hypothetical protein